MNEITFKKIWTEDGNFYEPNTMYEVNLTIKTDDYYIKRNFYVCNDLINEDKNLKKWPYGQILVLLLFCCKLLSIC